jgi:predicted RNA-binding Zn-ribbon protein involved in translation (DUF1610 family)
MMTSYDIMYACPTCEDVNTNASWNQTTKEYYTWGKVEEITNTKTDHYYLCPSCNETVNRRDIIDVV